MSASPISSPMRKKGATLGRWLPPAALLAALVGAWQLAASTGAIADVLSLEPFLVPSPAEIGTAVAENRALLADNAWVTLREILLGLAVAIAVGLAFAVLIHVSGILRLSFYPLLIASQTIPILVLAPILVVWFGYGSGPKVAIVALVCFFPITIATAGGLRAVDTEAIKMMRTLDASRRQILAKVEAPAALPYFFNGARLAAVFAPIGAIFGEWAGADAGLGHMILLDNGQLQTARVFAAALVLAGIALALFGLIALVERRVVRWR
ncbi:MAG TPA: ABC transporter permease [Solirubrobacterales bacterium]|nr:ABC transporter permease [Solirubrobacterales bacterium]